MMRGVVAVFLASALLVGACSSDDDGSARRGGLVVAAETLCPPMWTWVKDVGAAFNDAAADVTDIDDAAGRRGRWFDALAEIRELNAGLLDIVAPHRDDPVLAPLVAEIERDVPLSEQALDDIEALFVEFPEVDEGRHQDRTMQIIVRIEKVIDLPKPELAPLDPDGTLRDAFATVPSCQHSLKDVNDGVARANG